MHKLYTAILKEELIPAMGCTEPIAIAYAAAKAKEVLGQLPDKVVVEVSGNILKNVKSVVVPHTGGLRGIPAAAAIGIVAGDSAKELEVLSQITEAQIAQTRGFLDQVPVQVHYADTPHIFDIMITVYKGADSAFVRIAEHHTNLVCIRKNGDILLEKEVAPQENGLTDHSVLNIENITPICYH